MSVYFEQKQGWNVAKAIDDINLDVIDYYYIDKGNYFDQHFYMIQIMIENLKYIVDRSYVDFIKFDRLIRKKFPESKIEMLLLDAKSDIMKSLTKDSYLSNGSNNSNNRNRKSMNSRISLSFARESFNESVFDSNSTSLFPIPSKYKEVFMTKMKVIDNYLKSILTKHEIVTSDEFLNFFDEEVRHISNTGLVSLEESLNVHDLLLINTIPSNTIVMKHEEHKYHIPAGHMILWRFQTKHYDIGFSVEMNHEIKMPYTRYASHKAPIQGALDSPESSICILKWDNSYAKFRSKSLSWTVLIVPCEEYHTAKAQALECQREKKRFEQQRYALQRCATQQAAKLSGVLIQESSIIPEYDKEESLHVNDLENEVMRLQKELGTVKIELKLAIEARNTAEARASIAEQSNENISGSWQYSASQLQVTEEKLQECYQGIDELNLELDEKEAIIEELDHELQSLQNEILLIDKKEIKIQEICMKEINCIEYEKNKIFKKIQERKQEYYQLKSNNNIVNNNDKYIKIIEKLFNDFDKFYKQIDNKNEILKDISEQLGATINNNTTTNI